MKKHDLQPTDENIRNTFIKDSIGRNKDLLYFIKIIDSIDESFSIALDSYWGSGKTFFVKQVKMILDANNEFTYDSVEEKDKVIEKWNKLLGEDEINTDYHIPIYYDAWANDNDNDPILSIVYQIIQTVGNHADIKEQKGLSSFFNLAGDIFALVKGFNPLEIAKKLKSENPLEAIIQTKSLKERIDEFIESLIPEHGERLLIIIDELDRCNPEFAVKLLERIKHYFNNDRVTFVFSVNLFELQHTIKQHYGANFNAIRYLDRFFDLRVALAPLDIKNYFRYLTKNIPENVSINVLKAVYIYFDLQMRECTRLLSVIKIYNSNTYGIYSIINEVLLPFTWGLMITDIDKFKVFISGTDGSELVKFIESEHIFNYVRDQLIMIDDSYDNSYFSSYSNQKPNVEDLEKRINLLYSSLFSNNIIDTIGMCRVDSKARDYFRKAVSLLSDNIMLEENKEELGV